VWQAHHFALLEPSQQKAGLNPRLGAERWCLHLAEEPHERDVGRSGHGRYVEYDMRRPALQLAA
jgi:hypothetical protein